MFHCKNISNLKETCVCFYPPICMDYPSPHPLLSLLFLWMKFSSYLITFSPPVQYIRLSHLLNDNLSSNSPFSLALLSHAFSLTSAIILISIETYYNLFQLPPYVSALFYSKISQGLSIFPLTFPVWSVSLEPTTLSLSALSFIDITLFKISAFYPLKLRWHHQSLTMSTFVNSIRYNWSFRPAWSNCSTDHLVSLLPSACSFYSLLLFSPVPNVLMIEFSRSSVLKMSLFKF